MSSKMYSIHSDKSWSHQIYLHLDAGKSVYDKQNIIITTCNIVLQSNEVICCATWLLDYVDKLD